MKTGRYRKAKRVGAVNKKIKMNKQIIITAVLLIITIGNYFRIISDGSIRAVEFISVFAIGALTGMLIVQIVRLIKNRKINS